MKDIYTRLYGLLKFSFLNRKMRCKRTAVTLTQAFVFLRYAMCCYTVSNHTSLETKNDNSNNS